MNTLSEPQALANVLRGEFVRRFDEPGELVGKGSLTVTEEGLCVVASWVPRSRRNLLILLALVVAVAVAMLPAPGMVVAAAALVVTVAGIALAIRSTRARPFERTIPWNQVRRAGISDGTLLFELPAPRKGVARPRVAAPRGGLTRFRVPGYGLRELRPIVSELVRRSTGTTGTTGSTGS